MNARDEVRSAPSLWVEDRICCRRFQGTEAQIVDAGLVEAHWLPRKPGRNLTRQTVFFESDGALTFRGTHGGDIGKEAKGRHWLTIIRASARRYIVERAYLPSEERLQKLARDASRLEWDMYTERDLLGIDAGRPHWDLVDSSFKLMRAAIDRAQRAVS